MLKLEHDKAERKIEETTHKAVKLEKLRDDNDKAYLRQIMDQERKRAGYMTTSNFHLERKHRQNAIEKAKLSMYESKKQEVLQVKE